MKNQFNKYILGAIIITSLISVISCKKVLEVPSPPYEIGISDSFKDDGTATSAVMGIYGQIARGTTSNLIWGGLTLYSSEWAGEIIGTPVVLDDFATGQLNDHTSIISTMWASPYASLLAINTAIIQLNATTALTPSLKTELIGECYFMRAYIYFNVVNLWGGGAALTLSVSLADNRIAASTPTSDIYKQIVSDLKMAQTLLPTTDIVTDRGRPNKYAATALLAKTYLYLGQYSDAATQAQAVISSSNFSLPAPTAVFTQSSKETIWALVTSISGYSNPVTPDGANFIPNNTIAAPAYKLTPDLYNAFENGDLRKSNWIKSSTVKNYLTGVTATYIYPAKYTATITNSAAGITQNYVMLRLAEQYLILAEADYKLSYNAGAITNINIIRARAGLPALAATLSSNQIRAAIEQENRIEFFVEQGHRFFDLKRWPGINNPSLTRADEVLPALKPTWQPFNNLWPLPYADLQTDANLKQNPGYASN